MLAVEALILEISIEVRKQIETIPVCAHRARPVGFILPAGKEAKSSRHAGAIFFRQVRPYQIGSFFTEFDYFQHLTRKYFFKKWSQLNVRML